MNMTVDIDKAETYAAIDRDGMMKKVISLPEQIEETILINEKIILPAVSPENVLILGMGGSGVGGGLFASQYKNELKVPFMTSKSYYIPAFADKKTLTVAVSYSGNTEETLTAFEDSLKQGGFHIAITSGGQLKEISDKKGIPVVLIPPGLPPRSAFGYLYISLVYVFMKIGLVSDKKSDINEAVSLMKAKRNLWRPEVPLKNNIAKESAFALKDKIPIVYGSDEMTSEIAYRWKCQFNENSKKLSYSNAFPELNHNEIVGWSNGNSVLDGFHVIFLRDRSESEQIKKRISFTKELVSKKTSFTELFSEGDSKMARLMFLVYLGDLISVYLALFSGIDPTTIDVIENLKKYLKT